MRRHLEGSKAEIVPESKSGRYVDTPHGPPEAQIRRYVGRAGAKTAGVHLVSSSEPRRKLRQLAAHHRAPLPILIEGKYSSEGHFVLEFSLGDKEIGGDDN